MYSNVFQVHMYSIYIYIYLLAYGCFLMFFGTSQEQLKAKASEIGEQLAELPAAKAQLLELSQQAAQHFGVPAS